MAAFSIGLPASSLLNIRKPSISEPSRGGHGSGAFTFLSASLLSTSSSCDSNLFLFVTQSGKLDRGGNTGRSSPNSDSPCKVYQNQAYIPRINSTCGNSPETPLRKCTFRKMNGTKLKGL